MSSSNDDSGCLVLILLVGVVGYYAYQGFTKGGDPNLEAKYGKDLGLPTNCRAYVQASIDGYRTKEYTAEEAMNGLERNCGRFGYLWGYPK